MKTTPGVVLVRRDDQHTLGDEFRREDDAVVGEVLPDVCTDGWSTAVRLREGELSRMINFCEHDETGRIVMTNDDEQQRLGEVSGPGDDEKGGEVSDVAQRCLDDERKAERLGEDDLYCVQLSYRSANFGEHNLTAKFGEQGMTGQETHGIGDTADLDHSPGSIGVTQMWLWIPLFLFIVKNMILSEK